MIKRVADSIKWRWATGWMKLSGRGIWGRLATRMAELSAPPFYDKKRLAGFSPKGYISTKAQIVGADIHFGKHVFVDDRALLYCGWEGGELVLEDKVEIHRDTILQLGQGGGLFIGKNTCIQPRCQFSAYVGNIEIGEGVQIAPNCAFYPYNHSFAARELISRQPLKSSGGIVVEDDVWLGFGVVVQDGVRIGRGAVVGAGSVVCHDIPEKAIVAGQPAEIIDFRS